MSESFLKEYSGTIILMALLLGLVLLLKSPLLLIALLLFILAAGATHLWGQYALARVEYHRRFSQSRCFVGEEVRLDVELTNRKILPVTYLTVDDTVPENLHLSSRTIKFQRPGKNTLRLLFGLAWYQKVVRHYTVTPSRRGFYLVGPALMTGGDPFGYIEKQAEVNERESLVVYPKVVPLDRLGITTRRPFGDLKSRNRLFEDPMRFAGTREYQPGDPLSRVHWKATASAGSLQVRQLDPSANMGLAVFMNTWGWDLFWQGADSSALDTACVVAGSVAAWASQEGVSFGLYANGMVAEWGLSLRIPPARGPEMLSHALEGLARLDNTSRDHIAHLMAEEVPRLGYGTSVVVITRQVDEELAAAILRVQQSGRPVTLIQVGVDVPVPPALPGVRLYQIPGEEALHAAVLA